MFDASPTPWIRRRVKPTDEGCRLDVFLAQQPEIESRPRAKSLVLGGCVEVDQRPAKPGLALSAGQVVSFCLKDENSTEGDDAEVPLPELRVLAEDAYLLAIDKPAGVPVHPPENPRRHDGVDIARMARRRCGPLPVIAGEDRPGIVHRLDKDTSGVMVLAKTDEAFFFLQSQFKARTVHKEYRAICFGDPRFDSDYVESAIAVHPKRDRMMAVAEGGKPASTFYEVLERFGDLCYVRCRPRTGRTHQIRVHMASIGHPLVGDRIYRRRRAVDHLPKGAPEPGRHCLHAWSIALKHPLTHEDVMFEAEMPGDMETLLRWLRRRQRSAS